MKKNNYKYKTAKLASITFLTLIPMSCSYAAYFDHEYEKSYYIKKKLSVLKREYFVLPIEKEEKETDLVLQLSWDARLGDLIAQNMLGDVYYYGKGIKQDYGLAMYWYGLAMRWGNSRGSTMVGNLIYDGKEVTGKPNYKDSLIFYKNGALKGYAPAQYALGRMFYDGVEVEKNIALAMELFKEAAKQGNQNAQNMLGYIYHNGKSVDDLNESIRWYKKSAEQGNKYAQNALGDIYNNVAVGGDVEEAIKWFKLASEQNHAPSQYALGKIYTEGSLKPESFAAEGFRLLELASNNGQTDAIFALGDLYYSGYGVEQNILKAIELYELASKRGNLQAKFELGYMYYDGSDLPKDTQKGLDLIKFVAEHGDIKSILFLANIYETGDGVNKNIKEAIKWIQLAAENGNEAFQEKLGTYYENGNNLPKNTKEAVKWYRLAADQGNTEAALKLGDMYSLGISVKKDSHEAFKLYQIASNGNVNAYYKLATAYYFGNGTEKNIQEAIRLYRQSAEFGNEDAKNMLEKIFLGFLYRKDGYWAINKVSENGYCQPLITQSDYIITFKTFTPETFSFFSVPGDSYPNVYFGNGKSTIDTIVNIRGNLKSELKITEYSPFKYDLTTVDSPLNQDSCRLKYFY
jgi:TPR repeat protein